MDVVKQGYVRVRSKRVALWQKRWLVLRRASSKGPCRLEKYLDERSARSSVSCHKTIILSSVVNACRLSLTIKPHAFAINFDSRTCKWFACDSDLEADSWVKLLIQECLLPQPGLATGEPDVLSPGIQKELQEQFHVYLLPTPKLEVFGECLLQVTHENIYLWDVANSKLKLVAWPLTALRRYGSDPTKFTFEAGRHCATGEGMFIFHTLVGEQIYRKVHQATLAIAEAHQRSKRHHSNHSLVSGNQLAMNQINSNAATSLGRTELTTPTEAVTTDFYTSHFTPIREENA
ncbi:Docking protein 5 [Halotydeus destructor]|nr:Docking protein 5 [Halotydeus destructor]